MHIKMADITATVQLVCNKNPWCVEAVWLKIQGNSDKLQYLLLVFFASLRQDTIMFDKDSL